MYRTHGAGAFLLRRTSVDTLGQLVAPMALPFANQTLGELRWNSQKTEGLATRLMGRCRLAGCGCELAIEVLA
jgi:hypothetical protein